MIMYAWNIHIYPGKSGLPGCRVILSVALGAHKEGRNLPPARLARLFSEGGEVMKLHIEGSLTIPTPGSKGYNCEIIKHRSSAGGGLGI